MTVTVGEVSTFGNGPEIAGERNGTLYWRPTTLGINGVLNPAGGAIQTPTLDARGIDNAGSSAFRTSGSQRSLMP